MASSLVEPVQHSEKPVLDEDEVVEVFEEEQALQIQQSEFNDDERLQLLLQKVDASSSSTVLSETERSDKKDQPSTSLQESNADVQKPFTVAVTSTTVTLSRSNSMTTSVSSIRSPLDRHSFSTLLDRHNDKCSVYSRSINLKDVWDRYQTSSFTQPTDQIECPDIDIADETPENLGFEIVNVTGNYSVNEIQKFVQLACRLAREKGLDKQSFICKSCPTPLGIGDATRYREFV